MTDHDETDHDHHRDRTRLVPSFDAAGDAGRKLAIICSKGNLDMAYPGLILANAALGEGVETHLFFTFWGFDMINKKTHGRPEVHACSATPPRTCPRASAASPA